MHQRSSYATKEDIHKMIPMVSTVNQFEKIVRVRIRMRILYGTEHVNKEL